VGEPGVSGGCGAWLGCGGAGPLVVACWVKVGHQLVVRALRRPFFGFAPA